MGWLSLLLLLLVGSIIVARGEGDTIAGYDVRDVITITAGIAVALFIGSALFGSYRGRVAQAARHVFTWLLLFGAAITGYTYREELLSVAQRVGSEIAPPGMIVRADSQVDGERAVKIRRRPDGHFVARVTANGQPVSMLVDTGASAVVLKPADAQKLGIDIEKLRFQVPVQTANGTTFAAAVRLKGLAVGPIQLTNVEALVAKPGTLKDSLLGMTFLNRLRSYEFSGDFLTLRI